MVEPTTNSATVMTKIAAIETNALRQNPTKPDRTTRLIAVHIKIQ
jgi:hypothetical protein